MLSQVQFPAFPFQCFCSLYKYTLAGPHRLGTTVFNFIQEHPFFNCLFYQLFVADTLPKYRILTVQEIPSTLFWWWEKSKVCTLMELSNPTGAQPVSSHRGTWRHSILVMRSLTIDRMSSYQHNIRAVLCCPYVVFFCYLVAVVVFWSLIRCTVTMGLPHYCLHLEKLTNCGKW